VWQIDSTHGLGRPSRHRSDPIAGVTIAPETLPDDVAGLKRIIAEMARDAVAARAEIAKLKFQLALSPGRVRTLLGETGARG
jgi:hypothetical protein